jgi:hypothetical protein
MIRKINRNLNFLGSFRFNFTELILNFEPGDLVGLTLAKQK